MDELSNAVLNYVQEGDLILVKGSRGMALGALDVHIRREKAHSSIEV